MVFGIGSPQHKFKQRVTIIFLFCALSLAFSRNGISFPKLSDSTSNGTRLLLNSGLTKVNTAELSIIFWFEGNEEDLASINPKTLGLPDGWNWRSTHLKTTAGRSGLTLSGYRLIDKLDEASVLSWYKEIAKQIGQKGGRAYLDERINDGIDISAYLMQNQFEPRQWIISGNTISIGGWHKPLFPTIRAGQELLNIQLLTRSTSQGSKTVLAIPALLEEF